MSTVEEIKAAIENLVAQAVAELADWLSHRTDDAWDQQMSADIAGGRLDDLVQKARQSARSAGAYPLPGDGDSTLNENDKEPEARK